ncbi:MAG: hypothetical protein EOP45_20690 [Sphingobacteriaceae bacterium]|nr:MAG: hypothetical protein EOP45_20690 [Sphingobacteriaceae bacterium]
MPRYDVDLAYFTDHYTYIIDPSGLIAKKKSLTTIYNQGKYKIERTARLDTTRFHMATAYETQDSSVIWYKNPVMLCSDYEVTHTTVNDVPNIQTWATMVMHEYFHGFQFRHRAFIRYANDSVTISNRKLQAYYDNYPWFRGSVNQENQLLLRCLTENDKLKIKQLFNGVITLRNQRLKRVFEQQKILLGPQEEFLEKMEGSARYVEYQLYISFKNIPADEQLSRLDTAYKFSALKNFTLKSKPWMYESSSVYYFYSTGFNMLRLLDKLHVSYKQSFFDNNNLTPYHLLCDKLK